MIVGPAQELLDSFVVAIFRFGLHCQPLKGTQVGTYCFPLCLTPPFHMLLYFLPHFRLIRPLEGASAGFRAV